MAAAALLMFDGRAQDAVKVTLFSLCGRRFMCSDSPIKHNFSFTPACLIFIDCDTAEELGQLLNRPSEEGQEPSVNACTPVPHDKSSTLELCQPPSIIQSLPYVFRPLLHPLGAWVNRMQIF